MMHVLLTARGRQALLLTVSILVGKHLASAQEILVKPYVQPGHGSTLTGADEKILCWLTDQKPGEFRVEYGRDGEEARIAKATRLVLDFKPPRLPPPKKDSKDKKDKDDPKEKTPPVKEKEQHYYQYTACLSGLPFDAAIHYRVRLGEQVVREGEFHTRSTPLKSIRFVAVGDLAVGGKVPKRVAYQISKVQPEFLLALGDIVYPAGRVNQYMSYFWKTYNDVDAPGPANGAPLMASIPFYPVIGNHDVAAKFPDVSDALAVYRFFHAPANGPGLGPWNAALGADKTVAAQFRSAVGDSYPALDNYSFDNGPAHFLVLNSGRSATNQTPALRRWVEQDLRGSAARWKFVCFHVPAFHTSQQHFTEQHMRLWEPLFESCGVDLVFSGHVHNYQRSLPLRFVPSMPKPDRRGRVIGCFCLDHQFDGGTNTHPQGIIHVVAGGGGAGLYSPDLVKTIAALKKEHGGHWTSFTARYVADRHSFVVVDLNPTRLQLRAVDEKGDEVDRIVVNKP